MRRELTTLFSFQKGDTLNTRDLFEVISGAINDSIQKAFSDYDNGDKTFVGTIIKTIGTNEYIVKYNGIEAKIHTKNNLPLKIGDRVHVIYPLNKSKDKVLLEDLCITNIDINSLVKSVDGKTGDIDLSKTYASIDSLSRIVVEKNTIYDFPSVGKPNTIYVVTTGSDKNTAYRWSSEDLKYYKLSGHDWKEIEVIDCGEIVE